MSNSDAEDFTDSDYDPDDEYVNQWPQKNNRSKSNTSASEESENKSEDDQEGCSTKSKKSPNVLKKLTRNYISEIYEILDARKETNYRNALAINKEMQNKLIVIRTQIQALHGKVVSRYAQNEERLIDNMGTKKDRKKMGIFGKTVKGRTFYIRGNTFFKDENMRNCPNNEDYTRRCRSGEIFPMDFDLVARHIWSITDKMAIVRGIKEQIIAEKSLQVRVSNKNAQLITLLEKVGKEFKIDWTQISSHSLSYRHSPTSCKAMWEVYLQPALKHDSFSTTENELLLQAVEKYNFQNWSAIAKEVGKRSDYQCFLHYHTSMSSRGRWRRWDRKDDSRLLEAIEAAKCNGIINWSQVAFQFPQKSKASLQQRYQYTINPSVSHAPFTAEEDLLLLAAVQEYGTNFAKVPRSLFPNRSIIQLRSRYNNTLQHRHKSTAWTLEDDKFLMEFVKLNGVSSWKKLEDAFENRHTRISCRQRYHVIQRHLSKDANATLEQMVRKKFRMVRSDVTTTNWQQKVEELRTNPTDLQDKTVAKKRKRKAADVQNRKTKQAKNLMDVEARELESSTQELVTSQLELSNEMETIVYTIEDGTINTALSDLAATQLELNNEMETIVDTIEVVTKNTALSAKPNMIKSVQNHICSMSKAQSTTAPVSNVYDKNSETSVVVYNGVDANKNKPVRQTKKPIYIERLRANGLRFHDFLKYSYNFQFGREPIYNLTCNIKELEKAKECLGFQMPSSKDAMSCVALSKEYNLNGLCASVEFRQNIKKFIRSSIKPGTTSEPANKTVPPNFSTLATLRALCALSADYAKRKEKLSKSAATGSAESNDCAAVPITAQNLTAIERFRQRFRNIFYQAAVLSRLPPSSLQNQSLLNASTTPTEFYRPLVNTNKKVLSSVESTNVIKTEFIIEEAEPNTPIIKSELDFESYKDSNQESEYS